MNTPNLIKPQGSLLEQQKSKTKSNLFIAVITILTLHVALFGGLLIHGCKQNAGKQEMAGNQTDTDTGGLPPLPTNEMAAIPPIDTNPPPVQPLTSSPILPTPQLPSTVAGQPTPITPSPTLPAETAGAVKEYTVAKNDSFSTIAKSHGVTVSAIAKANPNVDSRKLKVGQILQIPAPAAASAADAGVASTEGPQTGALKTYTVKAGDTLTRIARIHGTTVRALRSANNLKTDQLHVGKKLKIPAGKTPAPTTESSSATTSPAGGPPDVTLPLSSLQR